MNYNGIRIDRDQMPQEEILMERLEDLRGRLQEFLEHVPDSCMSEKYDRRFYSKLTDNEIDYATASSLQTVEDVLTAIFRTEDKLWSLQCEYHETQRTEDVLNMEVPGQVVIIGFSDVFYEKTARLAPL